MSDTQINREALFSAETQDYRMPSEPDAGDMLTPKSSIHRNKNAPAAKIPLQPQHLYLIPCFYRSASCRYLDQAITAYNTAHLPIGLLVWKPYFLSFCFSS